MPLYEYVCTTCTHKFDKLQSMASDGAECPHCEQPAKRVISLFAAVSTGGDGEPAPISGMGGGGCCAGRACACGGF